MLNEIDKDFYCSNGYFNKTENMCNDPGGELTLDCLKSWCGRKHRKYPTPEQYKQEYGQDYPLGGAVFSRAKKVDGSYSDWQVSDFGFARLTLFIVQIVCACTPFGKPPDDWRPR